ncbi:MAG: hypothetical protein ABFQ64_06775 [Campylobacterota bacterium]
MKRVLKTVVMVLIITFGFAGCRTASVLNVPQQEIHIQKADKAVTQDDVFRAIAKAAGGLGWMIRKQGDGVAEVTLLVRDHKAVATINYTATDYSITYKSSSNLKYNESEQTIHKNYNGWIKNLDNSIKVQLSLL